jgi:hypothetical protein
MKQRKFTPKQIHDIRRLAKQGCSLGYIASLKSFQSTRSNIGKIVRGEIYAGIQ